MNAIYRSKNFLGDAREALNEHELLEISIKDGWRARMLAKEVGAWMPVAEASEMRGGLFKVPSPICSLLIASLLAIHYAALSARYEMRSEVNGSSVVLIYSPL